MKKVILASVLTAVAASTVNAAPTTGAYCAAATAAGNGTAATVNTGTDNSFVKVTFTPKCSANTHVTGEDGGSYFRVGAGSVKGKTRFAGSSAGGGVVLAMMADIAIAAETTRLLYPEAKVGIFGGVMAGLVSRMPHKVAMEFMLIGEELSAQRSLLQDCSIQRVQADKLAR